MKPFIIYLTIFVSSLLLLFVSCNKKDKLIEDVDPTEVNIVITQPSLAMASFIAKCTNYDIRLDTVIFLDPNSSLYYQNMNNHLYEIEEEFTIGGYTPVDGMWILQFRGEKVEDGESFDVSLPYDMNLDGDEDEE